MIPGRRSDEDGFYMFETQFDGLQGIITPHISAEGLRRLAQKFPEARLVPKESLEQANLELISTEVENQELREQLAELQAFKQNLAGVEAEGFRVAKKKGPQVKPEAVSV
jgi:hypothetical protein